MTGERMREPKYPQHPWRETLPNLIKGKGNFYHYGANYTVDPIVISRDEVPSILLIQRQDTGDWALPGGFVDDEESAIDAGLRELQEETNIALADLKPIVVYEGPVDDPRSTLNAWPETTALLWRCDEPAMAQAGDDAVQAQWVPLTQLPVNLYGSHAQLIDQAITQHGTWAEQLAYRSDKHTIAHASGGHMGYERHIITTPERSVFIKRHNAACFTDGERESHSRKYLQKEYNVYAQLGLQSPHIPSRAELISDHTLLLEAYQQHDGWQWRAPQDTALQSRYISDVLTALSDIQKLTFTDTSSINDTVPTLHNEGWRSYGHYRDAIVAVLEASPIHQTSELAELVDELYAQYGTVQERPLSSFCHGDLRQSNLAWHPEHGVRIIDWSWAGQSTGGLDATSFLIDLAKSGIDVSEYKAYFDSDNALLLIGFWLTHGTWPTSTEDTTVRTQQIASAVTAWQLRQLFSAATQSEACE